MISDSCLESSTIKLLDPLESLLKCVISLRAMAGDTGVQHLIIPFKQSTKSALHKSLSK